MLKDSPNERKWMVKHQLHARGIRDERILAAFELIPRHLFVPLEFRDMSYDDRPLPIGHGQTISQPYIIAYMLQEMELTGSEHILEVGTGSGYQAAILSRIVPEVHTIELIPALADRATRTLAEIGVTNVHIHVGDGSQGWSESAPYDAIVVSAAAAHVPQMLLDQLADHGRLIVPVGENMVQDLELWKREGDSFTRKILIPVAFVPLRE